MMNTFEYDFRTRQYTLLAVCPNCSEELRISIHEKDLQGSVPFGGSHLDLHKWIYDSINKLLADHKANCPGGVVMEYKPTLYSWQYLDQSAVSYPNQWGDNWKQRKQIGHVDVPQ